MKRRKKTFIILAVILVVVLLVAGYRKFISLRSIKGNRLAITDS